MARSRLERRRTEVIWPGRAFLWGIGVGLLLSASLVLAASAMLVQRGVQVVLSADEVAQMVRVQVTRQVEADFPEIVAHVKAGAAAQVKAQMKNKIDAGAVRISDVVIPLPPEVLNQFQSRLENIVLTSVSSVMDGLDVDQVAAQFGDRAYAMVKTSLKQELNGKTFLYSPVRWMAIPVILRIE